MKFLNKQMMTGVTIRAWAETSSRKYYKKNIKIKNKYVVLIFWHITQKHHKLTTQINYLSDGLSAKMQFEVDGSDIVTQTFLKLRGRKLLHENNNNSTLITAMKIKTMIR